MKRSIIPGVQIRRTQRYPGKYTGRFDVLYDDEPCHVRIRRQAGEEGWITETDDGFEEVSTLADAVDASLQEEVRRVREATEQVREFVALLREVT